MLVAEQRHDCGQTEPIRRARAETETCNGEQQHRPDVQKPRSGERATLAEPDRPRMQAYLSVVLEVEERIEEVESCNPKRDCGCKHPRLPGTRAGDGEPRTDGSEPEAGTEPHMTEPGQPLEVRVDEEERDG